MERRYVDKGKSDKKYTKKRPTKRGYRDIYKINKKEK